jgi:hypothetical protein
MGPTFCTSRLPVNPYDQPFDTKLFLGVKFCNLVNIFQKTKKNMKNSWFSTFFVPFSPQKKNQNFIYN